MSFTSDLRADIERYTGPRGTSGSLRATLRFWGMVYKHPGIIAVIIYRFGRAIRSMRIPIVKQILLLMYYIWIYPLPRFALGIEIPLSCRIGGGLAVWHYGGIIFGGGVIAGKNLSVNSGVMIGRKNHNGPIAEIGDDVTIHAHALVLCKHVGSGSTIGAGSVVVQDVLPGKIVTGNPAVERSRKPNPTQEAV